MKKSLITAMVCTMLSCLSTAQQIGTAVFIDTIDVKSQEEVLNSIRKSFREKNIPEEVIEGYIKNFFAIENPFRQTQKREASLFKDSSIISMNYVSNNNMAVFETSKRKIIFKEGLLFKSGDEVTEQEMMNLKDSSTVFNSTGRSRKILGYICEEYRSQDLVYSIWVNKELPNEVNPGIQMKNINGAVLAFEAEIGNAITKSTLHKLDWMKLN